MLGVNDYVRMLDQDLADTVKALRVAAALLQRSRLRMIHLADAARRRGPARVRLDRRTDAALTQALVEVRRAKHRKPKGGR